VIERLYSIESWNPRLATFVVLKETAKQLKIQNDGGGIAFTHTIRRDDIGRKYFETPHAAWTARAARLTEKIEWEKKTIQKLRTELGMCESEAKRCV
jgi:2-succinyl-5-enolpyruvyl-6-hydroxy-3-cyclohexene-1-carboxylate synthase